MRRGECLSEELQPFGQHRVSLVGHSILDLSKIEAGRMELELTDFHLPTALDNALTLVRERAGRRSITLQTSIDERLGGRGQSPGQSGVVVIEPASWKDAKNLVGRDGIEPPTPGFSDLSLGIANGAEVLAS